MPNPAPIDDVAFRRFVRRLAPFDLFSEGCGRDAVRRQLVLVAAHCNDGVLRSFTQCEDICKKRWGLQIDIEEVALAIEQLVKRHRLVQEPDGWKLTDRSHRELSELIRTSKEVEARALDEWEALARRKMPGLGDEQVAHLREDLIAWIHEIIVERGVEAAVVLYPEAERFRERLEEIKALGCDSLPEREPSVTAARPDALRLFFEQMSPVQRRYFDNLLTTAYLMSAYTLDPAALDVLKTLTNGQVLYLDTNVIYSLLKLHGDKAYAATRQVLVLSRILGYRTCITPWTLAELQESVRVARRRLTHHPAATHGDATSGVTGEDLLIRAFRNMERSTGVRFIDFFDLHEQAKALLEIEGVELAADFCDEIDADKSRYDEEITELERVREGAEKPRPLQEHDVKHRLLIEKRRAEEHRSLSNAGYLLITNDQTVVKYANGRRRGEVSFAVSLEQWEKFVKTLSPRTNDYRRSMCEILDTPPVRAPGLVSQAEVIDAVARVIMQEKYPPVISARVLLDHAMRNGGDAVASEEARAGSTRDSETVLEMRLDAVEAELERERAARDVLEQELAKLQSAAPPAASDEERGREVPGDSELDETATVRAELDRLLMALRWAATLLTFVMGLAILVVPVSFGWIAGGWALVGDVCVSAVIMVGALAWRYGTKLSRAIITVVAMALDIVVAVHTFIA